MRSIAKNEDSASIRSDRRTPNWRIDFKCRAKTVDDRLAGKRRWPLEEMVSREELPSNSLNSSNWLVDKQPIFGSPS